MSENSETIDSYIVYIKEDITGKIFINEYFNIDLTNITLMEHVQLVLSPEDKQVIDNIIFNFYQKVCDICDETNDECPLNNLSEQFYVIEDVAVNGVIIDIFTTSGLHCFICLPKTRYVCGLTEQEFHNTIMVPLDQKNYVN